MYDDADWHVEAAVEAGYSEENGYAHIGLYLAWLIRHDLYSREFFTDEWVTSVNAGEMTGSDLMDAIDGKLVSDVMTSEGAAFSDWYYSTYLDDYAESFAGAREYAVADDAAAYQRIAVAIDRRYREWVGSGRPLPPAGGGEPPPENALEGLAMVLPARETSRSAGNARGGGCAGRRARRHHRVRTGP